MKKTSSHLFALVLALSFMGSHTLSAQKTPKSTWQTKPSYFDPFYAPCTVMKLMDDDGQVLMSGPLGVEIFHTGNGQMLKGNSSLVRKGGKGLNLGMLAGGGNGVSIGGGNKSQPSFDERLKAMVNVHHIAIPGRTAMLRFDMSVIRGADREDISLVDLKTGSVVWERKDLSWSLYNVKWILQWLAKQAGSSDAMAAIMGVNDLVEYPARYIESLVTFVPGQDMALINTFTGLVCLDLKTGKTRWTVSETFKGLSAIQIVEGTNTAVAIGGNPAWFPRISIVSDLAPLSNDILRIDLTDGKILWKSDFKGFFKDMHPGGFQRSVKSPDIRIMNDLLFCNFYQAQVFDLATGDPILQTETGKDKLMIADAVPTRFAEPVVHNGKLYRTMITSTMAFGASVGGKDPNNFRVAVEAYDIASGALEWTSQEFSRSQIKTMDLVDGTLYIGFDGKEGIKALDARSGKILWEYPLGSRGVTTRWILDGQWIIAVERDKIHTLDRKTGKNIWSADLAKVTGTIAEISLVKDRILVEGEKKGIAFLGKSNGALQCQAGTGFEAIVQVNGEETVVLPVNAANAFMLLRTKDLGLKAGMKASKQRTNILWVPSKRAVYCMESGWLRSYPMGG